MPLKGRAGRAHPSNAFSVPGPQLQASRGDCIARLRTQPVRAHRQKLCDGIGIEQCARMPSGSIVPPLPSLGRPRSDDGCTKCLLSAPPSARQGETREGRRARWERSVGNPCAGNPPPRGLTEDTSGRREVSVLTADGIPSRCYELHGDRLPIRMGCVVDERCPGPSACSGASTGAAASRETQCSKHDRTNTDVDADGSGRRAAGARSPRELARESSGLECDDARNSIQLVMRAWSKGEVNVEAAAKLG